MALQFQDLPIPVNKGQKGSDNKPQIQMPDWLEVQNGEFDDRGRIKVVEGITNQALSVMTGETAITDINPTVRRLSAHQDELLLETWAGIYRQQLNGSFALAAASSNGKRALLRCARASVTSLADAQASKGDFTGTTQPNPQTGYVGNDAAVSGDYICTVWAEAYADSGGVTRSQVCWQVRHRTSDALVGRGVVRATAANVSAPRVVAFGGQFWLFAIQGGDIGRLTINPLSTQNVATALTIIISTLNVNSLDVALSPTQYCISYAGSAPVVGQAVFNQATPTVLVGGVVNIIPPGAVINVSNTYIDTGGLGINQAFVTFYTCVGTTTVLRWHGITPAGAGIGGGPGASGAFAVNVGRVFAFKGYGGSAAAWPVLVETYTATGLTPQEYNTAAVTYNATAASPGALASGVTVTNVVREHFVSSQPICPDGTLTSYTGVEDQGLLLGVTYASDAQDVFQVLDIARALSRVIAGGSESAGACWSTLRVFDAAPASAVLVLSNVTVSALLNGRACQPVPVPGETLALHFWCGKYTPNITNVTELGQNQTNLQRNTLRYGDTLSSVEFANLTYLPGGTPLVYDGQDVFEEGFTYAPEIISVTPAGAGGPLSVGTYGIVLVYEWFDGQGNRWQSPVSTPVQFVAAAANTYTLVARSLRASLKSGVSVVPYRTEANGTIYRRDSALGVTPLTDVQIRDSEPLYTAGQVAQLGARQNNALPSVRSFFVHQKRLIAVGGEDERAFFYSKEMAARFPAEWNRSSGAGLVPDAAGRLVAGSSLDDKFVLCGDKALAVVFGDGPNDLWLQNSFSPPTVISSAEGIRYDTPFALSVEDGFWYLTDTGPRLLTRGLSAGKGQDGIELGVRARSTNQNYIGRCIAAFVHPSRMQIHFLEQSTGRWFIYDTRYDQWTHRVQTGVRGLAVTRSTVWLVTDATVANNPLRYVDPANEDVNALTLTSGWVSFAGVQRFQRFTHLQVLGEAGPKARGSDFSVNLQVRVAYDPGSTVQNSTVVASPLSSVNTPWQVEFQMQRQAEQAYQFVLAVTPTGKGGDFSLTNLLARVGLKRGGGKLPASQRG